MLYKFDGFIFVDEFDPAFSGYRKKGKTKEYVPLHNYVYWQHTGLVPKKGRTAIHHIDGDRNNNEFSNLELITLYQHGKKHGHFQESSINSNKSGLFRFKGASYTKRDRNPYTKVWNSRIMYNRKTIHLGCFNDPLSCEIIYKIVQKEIIKGL